MNARQDLDRVDRATLRAWRAGNLLGWGALALVLGDAANWVAMNAASATAGALGGGRPAEIGMAIAFTAVVGALIGTVVGLHVYRSPTAVAGVVALLASVLFPEAGIALPLNPFAGWALIAAVEVAAASVTARALWSRRPRALTSQG